MGLIEQTMDIWNIMQSLKKKDCVEYHSAMKRNETESFSGMWMS